MLTRKQYVLAKIEDTYGEDASPDRSNLIAAANEFDPTIYDGETVERTRMRDYLGAYAQINVGAFSTIDIQVPLANSGTAGTAPAFGPLLRACTMSETESASDVVYQPVSDEDTFESVTLHYVMDGQLHRITGARGTWTLDESSGGLPFLRFTMTGFYNHPESVSELSGDAPPQADEVPVNKANTTLSLFGYSAVVSALSLDLGNTVNYRNLINEETVRVSDRAATGSITFDAPDLATKDFFDDVESHTGTTFGTLTATHGTTAGNIVELATTRSQLNSIAQQDSNGIAQYTCNMTHLPDAGDDELTLTFK
tara:strand:+ start:36 stop:968 length:933 start_codon:yes stop_codon:yes gene_type:complete